VNQVPATVTASQKEYAMADVKTLNDLFVHWLRRVYDAEQRLTKALPKLEEAADASDLKHAFRAHCEETETHVERLEQIFGLFGEQAKATTCESVKGIIKDADDMIDLDAEPAVRDAGLIAAAQEAEHFEIGAYGTLRTWAAALGKQEAMHILEWTLEEEKNADKLLTQIASQLNVRAAAPHAG
jgi:ferritin-like metal-binding protein YciE